MAGLSAALLVIGFAESSAGAAMPFTSGRLTTLLATLPPVVVDGNSAVVASSIGVIRSGGGKITMVTNVPANLFTTMGFVLPVTDPAAAPIKGIQVTEMNVSATFAQTNTVPNGPHLGGQMPLLGFNKVCLFANCNAHPTANLVVPISVVGKGGAVTASSLVNITAIGAPWTTGTAAVGTITMMGLASRVANPAIASQVSIRLVTPVFVSTNIGASAVVPVFGVLNLTPEPAVAATFGAAIATLLVLGRRRIRKS